MVRFLQLKIRNAADTAYEYDNYTDDSWGITAGTASLESAIMQDELEFGQCNSSMFQIQVFGIDDDISGRKIEVWLSETKPVYSHIISDEGDNIISDAGDFLSSLDGEETETKILFTGWIDSCKKDQSGIYRDIIAYDWIYYHREDNVADWWNGVWSNVDSVELWNFRNGLMRTKGPSQLVPSGSFDNDHMTLYKDTVFRPTHLTFETLMNMICTLQNTCYCCDEWGYSKLVKLDTTVKPLGDNIEGENSKWEDYTTNQITGVAVYDTSDNLVQLIGTNDNVYKIVGNLLLLNQSAEDITVYCNVILDTLSQIQYVPCDIKLIESDLSYNLGDKIGTAHGNSYIFKRLLSGSLLIDETLTATALNANLNADIPNTNRELIEGYKISRIEQNVDGIETEITNLKDGSSTTISQLSNALVVRLKQNGQLAEMALVGTGSGTEFKLQADNLDFIANDAMQLTAKELGIESTNFSVTKAGVLTAKSGTLGGWTFTDSMIFKEYTTGGITYRPMMNAPANPTNSSIAFAVMRTEEGALTPTTYPFRVEYDGTLKASDTYLGFLRITGENYDADIDMEPTSMQTLSVTAETNMSLTLATVTTSGEFLVIDTNYGVSIDGKLNVTGDAKVGALTAAQVIANDGVFDGPVYANGWIHADGGLYSNDGIELYNKNTGYTPFIDFHYNNDSMDYTARLIADDYARITFEGRDSSNTNIGCELRARAFTVYSSKKVKKNIKNISEAEAKKLLQLRPVSFDYKTFKADNQRGFIAEEVAEIMPEMVTDGDIPAIDYAKFVPSIVKMLQIQQKQIDKLSAK